MIIKNFKKDIYEMFKKSTGKNLIIDTNLVSHEVFDCLKNIYNTDTLCAVDVTLKIDDKIIGHTIGVATPKNCQQYNSFCLVIAETRAIKRILETYLVETDFTVVDAIQEVGRSQTTPTQYHNDDVVKSTIVTTENIEEVNNFFESKTATDNADENEKDKIKVEVAEYINKHFHDQNEVINIIAKKYRKTFSELNIGELRNLLSTLNSIISSRAA